MSRGGRRRGCVPAQGAHFRSGPARARFPGGSSRAPSGADPGLRRRRAGRRLSSAGPPGGGRAPAAPLSSPQGWGPGGQDVPEPRGGGPPSAAFPGAADVNSRLPAGEEAACRAPFPGKAGRLAGGPGRSGERGPEPPPSFAVPGPGRSSPRGCSGPRVAFAARVSSLAPGLGGRSAGAPGAREAAARASAWAEGPSAGRGRPRRPAGRAGAGARGEPGPTWNESEITLFNYTFPRPPSAIGAF